MLVDPVGGATERLERFAELVAGDAALVPLDQAALALAAVLRPDVDADETLGRLDRLAAGCRERTFDGLRHHLFDVVGFGGDRRHYDDPANSFLDLVVARRRGLPILLATVMMEVGRRADIGVVGIGLPMHFLVGDPRDPHSLADPATGAALDPASARQLLERLSNGALKWDNGYLDPVPARAMVVRMLTNLRASFARRNDAVRYAVVSQMRWQVPELQHEVNDAARVTAVLN